MANKPLFQGFTEEQGIQFMRALARDIARADHAAGRNFLQQIANIKIDTGMPINASEISESSENQDSYRAIDCTPK